jgi:hypothetical protein
MKNCSILVLAMVALLVGTATGGTYSGGTGEPNDPYRIATAEDLNDIGNYEEDWDKHFILVNDINLAEYTGEQFKIIGRWIGWDDDNGNENKPFIGVFDGNGRKILNFNWSSTETRRGIGLFGFLGRGGEPDDGERKNGEIKNLTLENVDVNVPNGDEIGGLVGYSYGGIITNCYSTGSVRGGYVGGLVGESYDGTITDCHATGNARGDWYAGGLVGYNYGTLANCYATNAVDGNERVGGLVGLNNGNITTCYSTGNTSGIQLIGGLVGSNGGTIANCYSSSNVSGTTYVGGLVGYSTGRITTSYYSSAGVSGTTYVGGLVGLTGSGNGQIANCYSTGSVSGVMDVGGLVGLNYHQIIYCYSIGTVSGTTDVGGLVGYNSPEGSVRGSFWDVQTSGKATSSGGTGKTTAEMHTASTFLGWWCQFVWTINEGNDYPKLVWENAPGEPMTRPYYGGGSGDANDPYLIYTAEQLNTIGVAPCDWDKHFKLMADIDLSSFTGTSFNIIGNSTLRFTGVFDGNDHIIYNFTYTSTKTDCIGLFAYVGGNAVIKNVGLIDPNVNAGTGDYVGSLISLFAGENISGCYVKGGKVAGSWCIGGLVGSNSGIMTNCYANTDVSGDRRGIGGLVGGNVGKITECFAACSVLGNHLVGGLVGSNDGQQGITNCYSTSTITGKSAVGGLAGGNGTASKITDCWSSGDVSGESRVGGLVGDSYGIVTCCYATGNVVGNENVGGLVGWNSQTTSNCTSNCYSTGSVSGNKNVGGLMGLNGGTIINCYSTGGVSGTEIVGGLVGCNNYGTIINCYSVGRVTGTTDIGGFAGRNTYIIRGSYWDVQTSSQPNSAGGTGKTTAQMQTAGTFAGWGCEPVWTIDDGNDYPRLAWENKPGQLITNPNYGGGSGTQDDPYLIYTAEQLNWVGLIMCDWDKHFRMMADIDLSGYVGNQFNIIGFSDDNPFTGVFDGNGKSISNFTYTLTSSSYVGLFGCVNDPNAEIKNLQLIDPNVDGAESGSCGLLVGSNEGRVTNCFIEGGSVSNSGGVLGPAGGLVGSNSGTIANCNSSASVSGREFSGGLVGWNEGTIVTCHSSGDVSGIHLCVGGLIGGNSGIVFNCYSDSNVFIVGHYGGGLVGGNSGTIADCYSTGSVYGGSPMGGLVGSGEPNLVTASFWDKDTSGLTTSAGGEGKTTAEMKTKSTFTAAGWDFVDEIVNGPNDVWRMCVDGVQYPLLSWQFVPDFVCPDGVDIFDLAFFVGKWLAECDETNNFCNCTDTDYDGQVNLPDFAILALHWLEGQ